MEETQETFADRNPDLAAQIEDAVMRSSAVVLDMNGTTCTPAIADVIQHALSNGAKAIYIKNFAEPTEE